MPRTIFGLDASLVQFADFTACLPLQLPLTIGYLETYGSPLAGSLYPPCGDEYVLLSLERVITGSVCRSITDKQI